MLMSDNMTLGEQFVYGTSRRAIFESWYDEVKAHDAYVRTGPSDAEVDEAVESIKATMRKRAEDAA